MNSGADLLAEGFPHSDIRGSTIARISPRLFAACHVLHRLLAPRHPPNALIALNTPPKPARRTKPHTRASVVHTYAQLLKLSLPTNQSDSPVKQHATAPTHAPATGQDNSHLVGAARHREPQTSWRRSDSNRRPPACKAGALPLSYAPGNRNRTSRPSPRRTTRSCGSLPLPPGDTSRHRRETMGQGGLEPPTPRLSSVCSNQLSYWPTTQGPPRGYPAPGPTQPHLSRPHIRMRGRCPDGNRPRHSPRQC